MTARATIPFWLLPGPLVIALLDPHTMAFASVSDAGGVGANSTDVDFTHGALLVVRRMTRNTIRTSP